MQVILFQNIEKLGMQGEVVNVANGYYRNYLGPRGIAVAATTGNLKRLELKLKRLSEEASTQFSAAESVAANLSKVELTFVMRANEEKKLFGSVQDHDILAKLVEAGFDDLERRQIMMSEPIKILGEHTVKVKLHSHVAATLTVSVLPEVDEAEEAEAAPEAPAEEAAPEAPATDDAAAEDAPSES